MVMFTRCINVTNVNQAVDSGLRWLLNRGVADQSRNGPVLSSPEPVITAYANPRERVLFSPLRDCNPFFHCMEGIWMLAGRNDVEWISRFNASFSQFSDDGESFWGAYGQRWRSWFGLDQLAFVIDELENNPKSRRAVMQMWDASKDPLRAKEGGKDVPCNTTVFFRIANNDRLNMMVNNRSNDIFWGAYGANAVHMSMMMEFVATAIGVDVGTYYQSSWDFHAYTDVYPTEQWDAIGENARLHDYYGQGLVKPYPLLSTAPNTWLADATMFIGGNDGALVDPFFTDVAVPMQAAWLAHKEKQYGLALEHAASIAAHDWRLACKAWLERRAEKHRIKEMEMQA